MRVLHKTFNKFYLNNLTDCFDKILENTLIETACFIVNTNLNLDTANTDLDFNKLISNKDFDITSVRISPVYFTYKNRPIYPMNIGDNCIIGIPYPENLGVIAIRGKSKELTSVFNVEITNETIKVEEEVGFGVFCIQKLIVAELVSV